MPVGISLIEVVIPGVDQKEDQGTGPLGMKMKQLIIELGHMYTTNPERGYSKFIVPFFYFSH